MTTPDTLHQQEVLLNAHWYAHALPPADQAASADGLLRAVRDGQVAVVQQLLQNQPALANHVSWEDGLSVLAVAASEGRLEVVRVLLDHGADPAGWQGKDGRTALDHAANMGVRQQLELVSGDGQGSLYGLLSGWRGDGEWGRRKTRGGL